MSESASAPNGVMTQAAMPSVQQAALDSLRQRLNEYIAEMAPGKPVTVERGGQLQASLWAAIRFVLNKSGSDFVMLYAELLRIIAEHRRTVFHPKYVYRFMSTLPLSNPERKNFERVLNLLMMTCELSTRRYAFKQVDLKSSLAGFADHNILARVASFYEV